MAEVDRAPTLGEAFAARHAVRSIDEWIPELVPFLSPGIRVLDVGCGPGSITIGVAERVRPGEAVGIDPLPSNIEVARGLASEPDVRNVSFQVGDGLALPFDDGVFDVVYSHTVLHYFYDPGRAVAEQRRVTKPGGWVVAAGVRDFSLVKRYPSCPAWEKVEEARASFAERQRWTPKPERLTISLGQTQAARRCVRYFSDAGLRDLRMSVKPYRLLYPGAQEMEASIFDMLPWRLGDEPRAGTQVNASERESQIREMVHADLCDRYGRDCDAMVAEGLIDEETVRQAMDEARAWFANPYAFHFHVMAFIAGRVWVIRR